ncbi:MAG: hypothetical protein UHP28_03760 [Treponema sp.]|nr:hypothetical protein [Treponema sp.]
MVVRTFLFEDIAFFGVTPDGKMSEDSAWTNNYDSFIYLSLNYRPSKAVHLI